MKRDVSRIFTVPEEREGEADQAEDFTVTSETGSMEHGGFSLCDNGVTIQESSKCSTPIKDVHFNKLLHGEALSICSKSNGDEVKMQTVTANNKCDLTVQGKVQDTKSSETHQTEKSIKKKFKASNFLVNYCENRVHSLSLNDLQQNPQISCNRIPIKYYGFGLPRLTQDMVDDCNEYSSMKDFPTSKNFYNTISDPMHPVFRCDGLPISRSLYNEKLAHHYQLLDMERSDESSPGGGMSRNSFNNLVSSAAVRYDTKPENYDTLSSTELKLDQNVDKSNTDNAELCTVKEEPVDQQQTTSSKQEVYRRSLSLPLKTIITNDYENGDMRERSTSYTAGVLESATVKTRIVGLPITPLMSKLSSLAIEEKTSGFCSRDTTPGEFRDLNFPGTSDISNVLEFTRRKVTSRKREPELEREDSSECAETPRTAVLYLCGQQSMSLFLLLEEGLGQDPDLIHRLVRNKFSDFSSKFWSYVYTLVQPLTFLLLPVKVKVKLPLCVDEGMQV